jgi:hypothetical protein
MAKKFVPKTLREIREGTLKEYEKFKVKDTGYFYLCCMECRTVFSGEDIIYSDTSHTKYFCPNKTRGFLEWKEKICLEQLWRYTKDQFHKNYKFL